MDLSRPFYLILGSVLDPHFRDLIKLLRSADGDLTGEKRVGPKINQNLGTQKSRPPKIGGGPTQNSRYQNWETQQQKSPSSKIRGDPTTKQPPKWRFKMDQNGDPQKKSTQKTLPKSYKFAPIVFEQWPLP